MIDYEKVVHGLIDPLVEHRDSIMIRELPGSNEKDVSLLIVAEDDDTARLIGKRGVVANALREAVGIAGKADNSNPAAQTNLSILCSVSGFVNDFNKFFCTVFEIGKGASGHTSGTVKNQNNVCWIADDVRLCCQRQFHLKGVPAVNMVCA